MKIGLLVAAWVALSVPLGIIVGRILHRLGMWDRSATIGAHHKARKRRTGESRTGEGGSSAGAATG